MRIPAALPCLAAALLAAPGAAPNAAAVEIDAAGLFASLDANADGRVSRREAGHDHGLLFNRLLRTSDDDRDGRLTAEEFSAGLTPVRAEKDLVTKQGSRLPGSDALVVLIARMDANADRRLEPSEIPAQLRDAFDRMVAQADADKNGTLDTRELADGGPRLGIQAQGAAVRLGIDVAAELAALPAERRRSLEQMSAFPNPAEMMADPAQAAELFARLDADGDGLLTADEAPEGFARLMRRVDRNGDGKLSAAEFQAGAQRTGGAAGQGGNPAAAQRGVRQLLNRFDRNGDGALSREETPPRMVGNFDRLDQNADGALDAQELARSGAARGMGRAAVGGATEPQMEEMQ